MKEQRLLFLLLLTSISFSAQVNGVVLDSLSGKPIAYATIWVENENIGTTSEENGTFSLDIKEEKNIVFSALGYETKTIKSSKIETIRLFSKVFELEEIVLSSPENTKEIKVGHYESSGFRWRLNANYNAIHFKPIAEIKKHPYLKEIKFHTLSEIKKSKLRIRIVECNSDLTLGNDITEEKIVVEVKKGSKANSKDVSNLKIKIPENGFYIVFEKLLIEENKYCEEINYKNQSGEKTNFKSCSYQPNLAYIPSEENNVLYANNLLNWTKHDKIKIKKPKSYESLLMRKYHDKYLVPSIEITLTN
jgi:hypothetical protein